MIEKEELLVRLQADRQALFETIEDMPDEALARPGAVGGWSALDVLAYITAWDGESLRRIAFVTGQNSRPPHDVNDKAYWLAWSEKQVEMKRLMGPRGIKVDMAGTWVRLLARIESLSPPEYTRWIELDSRIFRERPVLDHARKLRTWREQWEQSLPWWHRLQRKLTKLRPKLTYLVY